MAKSKAAEIPPSPQALEHVLVVIQSTDEPVTASQVAKLLDKPHKLTEAKLIPILDEYVSAAKLHSYPPKTAKGKPRYWNRDHNEFFRLQILSTFNKKGKETQSKPDLRKANKQLSDVAFEVAFQSLIDSQAVYEHPPLPKKKMALFGRRPPVPEQYLKETGRDLVLIVQQLLAAQVPKDELRRVLFQLVEATGITFGGHSPKDESPPDNRQPVVDLMALMRSIEPAADNGALVACRELRRAAKLDKIAFDQAALDLARQGQLMLHRHDFASGLSPSEREELVTDGTGTYYVGMAVRREHAE